MTTATRAVMMDATGSILVGFRVGNDGQGGHWLIRGGATAGRLVKTAGGFSLSQDGLKDAIRFTPREPAPAPVGLESYPVSATRPGSGAVRAIAEEAQRRFRRDQEVRARFMSLAGASLSRESLAKPEVAQALATMKEVDADNGAWFERTIRTHGWIGQRSHGHKAYEAAVLMALHTAPSLRLGLTVQAVMRTAVAEGEAQERDLAALSDRIALLLGDPMAYGMQAMTDAQGRPLIPVIADLGILARNRGRIGEPPLEDLARKAGARILRIGDDGLAVRDR
jgi:hypothetical protein